MEKVLRKIVPARYSDEGSTHRTTRSYNAAEEVLRKYYEIFSDQPAMIILGDAEKITNFVNILNCRG